MSVASRLDLAMGEAGAERGTQRGRARENRKEGGRQTVRQTDSETDRWSVHSQTSKAVRRTKQLGKGKPVS